jgi:hypothetical protein
MAMTQIEGVDPNNRLMKIAPTRAAEITHAADHDDE